MKKKIGHFIGIATVVVLTLFVCTGCKKNGINNEVNLNLNKDLDFTSISVSNYSMYHGEYFDLDGFLLTKKLTNNSLTKEGDSEGSMELTEEQINEIKSLVNQYQDELENWNGETYDGRLLGGSNSDIEIKFTNGDYFTVETDYSDEVPSKLKDFRKKLLDLFEDISEDLEGTDYYTINNYKKYEDSKVLDGTKNYEIFESYDKIESILDKVRSTDVTEYEDKIKEIFSNGKNAVLVEGGIDASIQKMEIKEGKLEVKIYYASPLISMNDEVNSKLFLVPVEKNVKEINIDSEIYPDRIY